jgi:myo-inositol-1(or 4)-monophosphatase
MDTPLEFAKDLAERTGEQLQGYFHPLGVHTEVKADNSALTEADLAADRMISNAIRDRYPQDGILTEEAGTVYPAGKTHVWIIDPLDGTTNFSLGLHYWGVSIARLTDGVPDLGVLYFPIVDEMMTAQRGQGAYLNEYPIEVEPPDKDKPFSFFACCSRTIRRYHIDIRYKARVLGSAAFNLSAVARGSAVIGFETSTKVWDIAAAWLLIEEAGGVIQALDGGSPFPLSPGLDYGGKKIPVLAAATPDLIVYARENLTPKDGG